VLLEGKKLLITGVLDPRSIAFHVAKVAQEQGAEIVLTSFGRARRLTERSAARLPDPVDYQPALEVARAADDAGEERTILFNLSGHGHFDMAAYDNYFAGKLQDVALDEAEMQRALAAIQGGHVDAVNFAADGIFPEVTSRDGWTHTAGASHRFQIGSRFLKAFRTGVEFQRADTVGTDFAFYGGSLFAATETPLTDSLWLVLQGGWGYRHYDRFEFEPSRDEHIWRAGAELRQQLTDHLSAAAVFNYDRFDSRNPLFAAERFLSGVVLTFEY
jgi:hypothetical protein